MEKGLPISAARAVFLSDAHLNQDDVHSRNFVALAGNAAAENAAVFLLGDVFDLWFGSSGLTFQFQKPIVSRLRELRAGGLRLYYVEGNRDFYLKKYHEGSTFDSVEELEMPASVAGRRLYLSHGDAVNPADTAYRFWKAVSKNRLSFGAVSALPSSLVLPLADWMERKLKKTNHRFRGSFPEKDCRDFAMRKFAAGMDYVILGHFHNERFFRFPRPDKEKALVVLPSWREGWRYFFISAEGDSGFRTYHPGEKLVP
ncbi:MAG: UDP-2,3-diacylglucosamine diphosphatase [Deltaproteobacteria bacterium]|nr:UDP-2,3-diacylglucosamine diphosphatase [Deltaproteobacteria bacterium]